jgi:hypothetical protein
MERNLQKNNLINLFTLLVAAVATFAASKYGDARSGQVAAGLLFLGVLVAAVTWFQAGLEERERLEKLEFDEVTKGGSSSTLFQTQEAEAFPARRSREQFEKFFVPGFTVVLMLLEAGAFWWFWRWLDRQPSAAEIKQPLVTMSIAGLVGLVCFLMGKYSAGLAQLQTVRLLNPSASHLLLGAYLLWLVVAVVAAYEADLPWQTRSWRAHSVACSPCLSSRICSHCCLRFTVPGSKAECPAFCTKAGW